MQIARQIFIPCPPDHAAFLAPDFDSRVFSQRLLNGSSSSTANETTDAASYSFAVERRALDAVQQLGLPCGGVSTSLNSEGSSASNKETVLYTPMRSSGTTSSSGDVSAALSKLSYAVDDLNKQLRSEINTHHAALLVQAGSISSLEDNLRQIRGGLDEVESSVDRLRRKISMPYAELSTSLTRLAKLQRASDLARRASRFVTLARRLDVQMAELNTANVSTRNGSLTPTAATSSALQAVDLLNGTMTNDGGERALSEAALTLAELGLLPSICQPDCPLSVV